MKAFFRYLAYPFKALANVLRLLVNLSSQQIKALFSLAMLGGMISLSFQNAALTYVAKQAVEQGDTFRPFFNLTQEQMRFNSALIAWFALIMGLIVFGADFFRARVGDKEIQFGKGQDVSDNPMASPAPDPEFDL
jgi:lysylphosphatidylglycerol synthetase-like protein (DUF2156 family)